MKKILFSFFLVAFLIGCVDIPQGDFVVTVKNSLAIDRADEMVEIPVSILMQHMDIYEEEQFIVLDADSVEVPSQLTYNNNLLFPVSVKANGTATYKIVVGEQHEYEPTVYGRHYPERVDDIAWENDLVAFRCYGPALQASGEKAYGYDVWVKNTPSLVVEARYASELNAETREEISALRKAKKMEEADELYHSVSYHVDHGNGLDCYKVGPTLGAGTTALLDGDEIIYPYCWSKYEIMENGPLRFTVKLTYNPFEYKDETLVETRILSLAKGSQLNKTTVVYEGLSGKASLVAGLAIHPENPDAYALEKEKKFVAYQDLTDNIHNGNGEIYIGIVSPSMKDAQLVLLNPKEAAQRGAVGHALAYHDIAAGDSISYYWGSAWSKAGWNNMEEWTTYLDEYAQKLENPLEISF